MFLYFLKGNKVQNFLISVFHKENKIYITSHVCNKKLISVYCLQTRLWKTYKELEDT